MPGSDPSFFPHSTSTHLIEAIAKYHITAMLQGLQGVESEVQIRGTKCIKGEVYDLALDAVLDKRTSSPTDHPPMPPTSLSLPPSPI
jgi:hypothetical protein